jgi:hypothetical protein
MQAIHTKNTLENDGVAVPVGFKPTVQDIASDKITKLSKEHWVQSNKPFDDNLVKELYKELDHSRIMLLELNRYLELYLWPNYNSLLSSRTHILSIMVMVNAKFRENVKCWGKNNFQYDT